MTLLQMIWTVSGFLNVVNCRSELKKKKLCQLGLPLTLGLYVIRKDDSLLARIDECLRLATLVVNLASTLQ